MTADQRAVLGWTAAAATAAGLLALAPDGALPGTHTMMTVWAVAAIVMQTYTGYRDARGELRGTAVAASVILVGGAALMMPSATRDAGTAALILGCALTGRAMRARAAEADGTTGDARAATWTRAGAKMSEGGAIVGITLALAALL